MSHVTFEWVISCVKELSCRWFIWDLTHSYVTRLIQIWSANVDHTPTSCGYSFKYDTTHSCLTVKPGRISNVDPQVAATHIFSFPSPLSYSHYYSIDLQCMWANRDIFFPLFAPPPPILLPCLSRSRTRHLCKRIGRSSSKKSTAWKCDVSDFRGRWRPPPCLSCWICRQKRCDFSMHRDMGWLRLVGSLKV